MENFTRAFLIAAAIIFSFSGFAPTPDFSKTRDSVIYELPAFTSHSAGAMNNNLKYWIGDTISIPTVITQFNNPGDLPNATVFSEIVEVSGLYYVFVVNPVHAQLIRLDFGNSPLNRPSVVNLGTISGLFGLTIDSIWIVNEAGKWYISLTGSDPDFGKMPEMVKLNLGTNISNNTPTAVDWRYSDELFSPMDLYRFKADSSGRDNALSRTSINADFTYKQDICNPLQFEFKNETAGSTVIDWNFGIGQVAAGEDNPSTTFAGFGNYNVTLTLKTSGGDIVSISKLVTVQVVKESLIINEDSVICLGDSITLKTVQALSYCWTPSSGLSATHIANPVANPLTSTTYYLHALIKGANLIVNGDFSAGNTGFISEYQFANPNTLDGQFFVGTNPKAWNPSVSNCSDHTSGYGNMLLVNGSPDEDVKVWSQTINVTPNTNYAFSTWIQALYNDNPAELQFFINGNNIGNLIKASLPTCTWDQFYTTWNSGNNTVATIAVVNRNTETLTWGNDFALDDISFAPVTIARDSVVITVEEPPVVRTSNDTLICEGSVVPMNTTGAANYSWAPAMGLSASNIANPQASPVNTTQYIVTGFTAAGCRGEDTVTVSVNPKPTVTITADTLICANSSIQLNAGGGNTYTWAPDATLDNAAVPNPVASPVQRTVYRVLVTGANNCTSTDSVSVGIRPYPEFSVSKDLSICRGSTAMLTARGGDHYQWTTDSTVHSPSAPVTGVSPVVTTNYSVRINESTCHNDTLMNVRVEVNPTPVVTALRLNDINCTVRTAQLEANGADHYSWSPGIYLNDKNRANPVAALDSTTTFVVTGTNQYGCSATDSVVVKVTTEGRGLFLVPNAFTPNGDGLNDCFGISHWGNVQVNNFSIYNRWGECVFKAANADDCWDGTYLGKSQLTGSFAYIIEVSTPCGEVSRRGLVTIIR